ncbi:MAG: tRNA (N6-isopentenyl adenosine(37)-C2)-methylthiotransferase MiaB [Clostridia bacterium]|nr:tRNA (N6-isopentenyl adenosine(37)-C2)-methylthiotransferase MiaB [Clostridia bacterium]
MADNKVTVSAEEIRLQKEIIDRIKKSFGGKIKYALVETYGCQQNVNDSQRIEGMLLEMGYTLTDDREKADIIIFNTCAVRENAQDRVYGNLGALKHLKKRKPDVLIAVCGCMVQQEQIADRIRAKYRHVDLVFGTHALYRFPQLLSQVLEHREKLCDISGSGVIAEGLPVHYEGGAKAFVSIMYGCNNFCSYCIVPFVRGRERSRSVMDILSEIKCLADAGVKEVMLLGQNVNSYGKDRGEEDSFAALLSEVCKIDGIERIRFMSSHPKDISVKLLETMASNPKIMHQLHLPLQSGSNSVLESMNRHYTREKYLEIIENARRIMPDIALTTDIIVGYPTETQSDFEDTLGILRRARFDSIFSFIYSVREGTRAAEMENVSTPEEINSRFRQLLDVQNDISLKENLRHEGKVETVLVEGRSKTDKDMLTGRNYANKIVNFKGDDSLKDTFVQVKITKAQTWILYGELEK